MEKIDNEEFMWVEKYRPQILDDLILDDVNKERIQEWISNSKVPNLLLTSMLPGTGKSSIAHIIIKALNADALWINASKDSGIHIIRDRITEFASITGFGQKIIILDEVDEMPLKSQSALRGVIEEFSTVTFILTGNRKYKIDGAIANRMVDIELENILKTHKGTLANQTVERLEFIMKNEVIEYTVPDLRSIVAANYPSLRGAIQDLYKFVVNGKLVIDKAALNDRGAIIELLVHLKNRDLTGARNTIETLVDPANIYDVIFRKMDDLFVEGSIPAVIVKTNSYMNTPTVNPVISVIAFIADLMSSDKIKLK